MTIYLKRTMTVLGTSSLLVLAQPALAQEQEITVTANMKVPDGLEAVKLVVSIKDLDLATPAGASKMERRVASVINRFCEPPSRPARWQVKDSKACSDFAWDSARSQMDAALRKARGS
jgi:UrcA family protein